MSRAAAARLGIGTYRNQIRDGEHAVQGSMSKDDPHRTENRTYVDSMLVLMKNRAILDTMLFDLQAHG